MGVQEVSVVKTLSWGEGRMLLEVRTNASNYSQYTYNTDGLRTKKIVAVNGIKTTTEYVWGDNGLAGKIIRDGTATTTVIPHYDIEGEAVGFTVKCVPSRLSSPSTTNTYTYVKNLQGDVLRILDSNGNAVVNYTYDPWGKPTVTGDEDLAALNPCSYRGYDYDEETGFYYLQSRYFSPDIGRFISIDDPVILQLSTNDSVFNNIFVYCNNNPINDSDVAGYLSINTLISKLKELLNKAVNYLKSYVKSLFIWDKKNKTVSVKSVLISSAVDTIICLLIKRAVYNQLTGAIKLLLKNKTIKKELVKRVFDFFLYNSVGKIILRCLVYIALSAVGVSNSIKDAIFSDMIWTLACKKYYFLETPSRVISAFSSIGGMVAVLFDLMDGKPDDRFVCPYGKMLLFI